MKKRWIKRWFAMALALSLTLTHPPAVRAAEADPLFPPEAFTCKIFSYSPTPNGIHGQMQGACTDGRYIWAGLNHRHILVRLDTHTWEVQTREFAEEEWLCGHINDMAYNPNTNRIYVVGYDPGDWSTRGNIIVFDAITLEYRGTIRLRRSGEMLPINSIVYDRSRDQYIVSLAGMAGKDNVVLDSGFQPIGPLTLVRAETLTLQGFDTDGTFLYRTVWNQNTGNFITVYDMSGRFLGQIDTGIPCQDVELEDIMYDWNGAFYLNCSHRDGTGGSFYYCQLTPGQDPSILENILGRISGPADLTL